jgi:hypothetical protein
MQGCAAQCKNASVIEVILRPEAEIASVEPGESPFLQAISSSLRARLDAYAGARGSRRALGRAIVLDAQIR